jgi:DNA-binding transcriptional MerR regulator
VTLTDEPHTEHEGESPNNRETPDDGGARDDGAPRDDGGPHYEYDDTDTDASRLPATAPAPRPIAAREYYAISEVCDLVGLKPHVLRYWETQFPVLNPSKNRSGNRVYQRKEIKLILLVKHLLYKEKYTIDGAKQRLAELRKGGELPTETARALDAQMIEMLRAELQQALLFLTPDPV